MSNRVFKGDLSTEGINSIIEQLKQYAEVDLPNMASELVRRLAEVGITVAEYTVYSDFRPHIDFVYKPDAVTPYGAMGYLQAHDTALIHRVWYSKNGQMIGDAYISPLLMSEYGAGPYAVTGHRGTFPGQKHAFESMWYWYDESGERRCSEDDYLMVPTQPMYKALVEMMNKVNEIAREVFSVDG